MNQRLERLRLLINGQTIFGQEININVGASALWSLVTFFIVSKQKIFRLSRSES